MHHLEASGAEAKAMGGRHGLRARDLLQTTLGTTLLQQATAAFEACPVAVAKPDHAVGNILSVMPFDQLYFLCGVFVLLGIFLLMTCFLLGIAVGRYLCPRQATERRTVTTVRCRTEPPTPFARRTVDQSVQACPKRGDAATMSECTYHWHRATPRFQSGNQGFQWAGWSWIGRCHFEG